MSVTNFLALRYLKSSRENRFFSWITALSISGIAIGVAALIVVLSVINGFEVELRRRFLQGNAHIMAYRYPAGMVNPERWAKILEKDFPKEVRGISPFVHYETMVKKGSLMQGVLVRGIAPKLRENVQSLRPVVSPPEALDLLQAEIDTPLKPDSGIAPAIILGSGLLSILELKLGDTIHLVSPSEGTETETRPFKVVGIYNSGLKWYDNRLIVMSIPAAQSFFRMGELVTGIEIGLNDSFDSVVVTDAMKDRYNLTFREWQSFNKPLFDAMKKERVMIVIIVALVVFVAGFNILTTIFVSVSQKQKDISILKALGARNSQIVQLFIRQSIFIGGIGASLGIILALAISWALENYQFIDLPDPYLLKNLPVDYNPSVYFTISSLALLMCVLFCLYPALVAARVNPTEGLRGIGKAL